MLKHAALFAGIGGFELGIKAAGATNIRTDIFIENNPEAQRVLSYRFPKIKQHSDIRDWQPGPGQFNLFTIGFPCTGTSIAGDGSGLDHPESSMWFYALRAIAQGRPDFIIVENPTGLISKGLRAILGGLRMVEYSYEDPQIISAAELGAPHERERLFIIAYTNNISQRFREVPTGWHEQIRAEVEAVYQQGGQATPNGGGVDDGIPNWLGRVPIGGHWRNTISATPAYPATGHHLKNRRECIDLYGRAVTPQQAEIVLKRVCYLAELAGIVNTDKHRQSNHDTSGNGAGGSFYNLDNPDNTSRKGTRCKEQGEEYFYQCPMPNAPCPIT
ncbi:DNA cytosine methyltransferase [Anabaena sp. UHCC 0451]|uniref:DNA cytosine methyltransferase n=1 Tax=Anabaena sp. UHCC 0451 TaxID=2055235 RepID=UPI002B1E99FF|nr:DNA cytosine methyltransferase [Anabaena sp. UHCC 0451]MEA5578652.1 DNA cytosine methyltransferase [Anabaena sp. UHCC 0451]